MANSEFKTAAAKLLEQHALKDPVLEARKVESVDEAGSTHNSVLSAAQELEQQKTPSKMSITLPLILSLVVKRLSIGLAVVCCALMWLFVPELFFPKSYKIFNIVLGIVMGLTYGVILSFPHQEEGGDKT